MGTSCTKFQRRKLENIIRRHFSRLRDYLLAKFQRLRGNKDVEIRLQHSPMPYSSNMSNRTYIISTRDEAKSENVAPNDVVIELKRSASCCSAFGNDKQELELIKLENKDEIEAVPTISFDRRVRPKAAKGGRSITQILPTCVRELEKDFNNLMSTQSNSESNMSTKARPKAAKGVRTSMNIADGVYKDFSLLGEVVPSDEYLSRAKMPLTSRPQLTVPAVKTVEQIYLDNWRYRQMDAKHPSDSD